MRLKPKKIETTVTVSEEAQAIALILTILQRLPYSSTRENVLRAVIAYLHA